MFQPYIVRKQRHIDNISVNDKTHFVDDPPTKSWSIEETQSLENSILKETANCRDVQNKNNSTDYTRIQVKQFNDNTSPKNAISDAKAYHFNKSNTEAAVVTKQNYDIEISDDKFLTSKHECILSWLNSIESPNKDFKKFGNLSFSRIELPICPNSQNEFTNFLKSERVNIKETSRNIPTSSSKVDSNSKASESNTLQESLRHLNLKRKNKRRKSPKHNENNKNKEILKTRLTSRNSNNTEQSSINRLKTITKPVENKLSENLKHQSNNLIEKNSTLGSQELIPPTPPVQLNKTKTNSRTSYTSKIFAYQANANFLNYPNKQLYPDHVDFYHDKSADIIECTTFKKVDKNSSKKNGKTIGRGSVNDNQETIHKINVRNNIHCNKQNSKMTREARSKAFCNTVKEILKHQSNKYNVEIEDSPKEFSFTLEEKRYKHSTNLGFSASSKRKCSSSKGIRKRQKINDEDDVEIKNDRSSDDLNDEELRRTKLSLHKTKQTKCDLKREAKREVLAKKVKQFVIDLSRDLSQSHSEDETLSKDEYLLMHTVFDANNKLKKKSTKEEQATSSSTHNKIIPESKILPTSKRRITSVLEKSYRNTPLRSNNTSKVNISSTIPMASKLKPVLQSTVFNNEDTIKRSKLNIITKRRKSYESKKDDDGNGTCIENSKTNNIKMSASPKLTLTKTVDDTSSTTANRNDGVNKDVNSLQVKSATPLTRSRATIAPSVQPLNTNIQNENKQLDTLQSPNITTNVKEGKKQEDLFPVFMTSRLSRKYVKRCEAVLRKFGGHYSPAVDSEATHLIVATDDNGFISRNTYTYKYVMALVSRIWIVDIKWVYESAKAGKYIDEAKFEAKGDSMNGHENIPRLYRESGEKCQSLFDGYQFILLGKFQESQIAKDQLATLLKKLSCDIAFNIDEVYCSSSQITTLLVTANLNQFSSVERYKIKKHSLICVHPEWIAESIINYKIQDLHKFRMQFIE